MRGQIGKLKLLALSNHFDIFTSWDDRIRYKNQDYANKAIVAWNPSKNNGSKKMLFPQLNIDKHLRNSTFSTAMSIVIFLTRFFLPFYSYFNNNQCCTANYTHFRTIFYEQSCTLIFLLVTETRKNIYNPLYKRVQGN